MLASVLLFALFLAASAFFSSSETAFIAANPYTLESAEKKGSRRAHHVRRILLKINDFLATILIGNTLVNVAAASVATAFFVRLVPDPNRAVLLATAATTVFILFFGEINPKTYAAHHPLRVSLLLVYPVRAFTIILFPLVKAFTFITGLIMPSSKQGSGGLARPLGEEELRLFLRSGTRGLSASRRRMIFGVLDIGDRPVKEIMVPRPKVRAIEAGASLQEILETVRSAGYSRYPVYRGRLDNIEGLLHAKDIISYVQDHKQEEFDISRLLRRPAFVPELASLETALVEMQAGAVHLAVVVDEFGSMEGIVTLEDILEEIVGEISDEHDDRPEAWFEKAGEGAFLVRGSAPVKDVNETLGLALPERGDYTTLAGFLLAEFGRLPREKESFLFCGGRYTVERMNKRHISLVRVERVPDGGP